MSLQNVERLSGGLGLIALQPRNVTGFRVYLQTIFHVAHASHRQNSVDQLLNFVRQHRSGQDNPSVLSLNFYGRRMPDKKPMLRFLRSRAVTEAPSCKVFGKLENWSFTRARRRRPRSGSSRYMMPAPKLAPVSIAINGFIRYLRKFVTSI